MLDKVTWCPENSNIFCSKGVNKVIPILSVYGAVFMLFTAIDCQG